MSADWRSLLCLVEDYREAAADPTGEANEAAQAVADECVKLLLFEQAEPAIPPAPPAPPIHLFGPDAHSQPGYGRFPDSCGWPTEQCIGHAPRGTTAPHTDSRGTGPTGEQEGTT
jgi:hypothetical protein